MSNLILYEHMKIFQKPKLIVLASISIFLISCSKKFHNAVNRESLAQYSNQGLVCKEFEEYLKKNWQKGTQYQCFRHPKKLKEFLSAHGGCIKLNKDQVIELLGVPSKNEAQLIVYYMDDDCTWIEPPHATWVFQVYFDSLGIYNSFSIFSMIAG